MFFSEQALKELKAGREGLEGKYQNLLISYITLPLKDPVAKEYATQGYPRRLGIMVQCINNVFTTLPPERAETPEKQEIFDATINIQAFLVNAFGCIDNLARVWIHEKGLKTAKGKPLPKGEIGL